MTGKRSCVVTCSVLAVLVGVGRAEKASLHGLGQVYDGAGAWSQARAVSADGLVVVGDGLSGGPEWLSQPFRWTTADGIVGLGFLPGMGGSGSAAVQDVSGDGSVVVGGIAPIRPQEFPPNYAFRWTRQDGMVPLGGLNPQQACDVATGVSADSSVIVGQSSVRGPEGAHWRAFRWSAEGGAVDLGSLSDRPADVTATDVSADGSVVVGAIDDRTGAPRACRWTEAGGCVDLGLPAVATGLEVVGAGTSAISPDGLTVVGSFIDEVGDYYAYRWTAIEGMMPLFAPPMPASAAFAASGNGSVIVGFSYPWEPEQHGRAFIWDATHGPRALQDFLVQDCGLNLEGWELDSATDISFDGRVIVGWGRGPSGQTEGWIATIPEPSILSSSLVGILLMVAYAPLLRQHKSGV